MKIDLDEKGEMRTRIIEYRPDYMESCFLIWYQNGRPKMPRLLELIEPDEHGRKPHRQNLWEWAKAHAWENRADILDAEVSKRVEIMAIEERVNMLKKHAELGADLQIRGMEYLEKNGIEKSADAIRAIFQGAELERSSRGLPTALLRVAQFDDAKLSDVVQRLMKKVSPDELNDILEGNFSAIEELGDGDTDASEDA